MLSAGLHALPSVEHLVDDTELVEKDLFVDLSVLHYLEGTAEVFFRDK